jgi:hypothetical protein
MLTGQSTKTVRRCSLNGTLPNRVLQRARDPCAPQLSTGALGAWLDRLAGGGHDGCIHDRQP